MKLSRAECDVIKLIRSGAPFGLTIMFNEKGGEWIASTQAPPFDGSGQVNVGIGFSFDEAWSSRAVQPTVSAKAS